MFDYIIITALSSFYIFFFLPFGFMVRNLSEINLSLSKAALFFLFCSAATTGGCLYAVFNGYAVETVRIMFFILMFSYLGTIIILPKFGKMEGESLSKAKKRKLCVKEAVIFACLAGFSFVPQGFFIKTAFWISLFIIFEQLCFLSGTFLKNSKVTLSHKKYHTTYDKYNEFSKKRNIVTIVLDCFGSAVFQEYLKAFPETNKIFNDFEFYPFTSSYGAGTMLALPAFFTGHYPEKKSEEQIGPDYYRFLEESFSKKNHFLKKLKQKNYKNEIYPYMPQFTYLSPKFIDNIKETNKAVLNIRFLINLIFLHLFPTLLKEKSFKYVMNFGLNRESKQTGDRKYDDLDFYNEFKDGLVLSDKENCFKFYHLAGLHFPFLLNENLEKEDISNSGEDSLQITIKAYFKMIVAFLDKLRAAEIYDKTAIIIMGDHGLGYDISPLEKDEVRENSLLLYKGINQHQESLSFVEDVYPDVSDFYNLILYSAGLTNEKWNISAEKQEKNKLLIKTKHTERKLLRENNILQKTTELPKDFHNIETAHILEKDCLGSRLRLSLILSTEITVKLTDYYFVFSCDNGETFAGKKQEIFEQTFFVEEGRNYCSILASADLSACPDGTYTAEAITARTDGGLTKWIVSVVLIKQDGSLKLEDKK